MAKGDYYFPLYYQKLVTSCTGWSDAEFGAYIRLLIYQYDNGSVPGDIPSISAIAPAAKKFWGRLSKKFIQQGDGSLINEVMAGIRNKRLEKSVTLSKNGSLGGRPVKKQMVSVEKPNGYQNEKQIESNNNMVIDSDLSEGGMGETEKPKNWDQEKKNFADDGPWQIQFTTSKRVSPDLLQKLMEEFISDIELKQDFKVKKELQRHFTNWYNLKIKTGQTNGKTNHSQSTSAPLKKL